MSDFELAADVTLPIGGATANTATLLEVRSFALATTHSAISLTTYFGNRWKNGVFVRLSADQAFCFFTSDASEEVDRTAVGATTPEKQGVYVAAGAEVQGKPRKEFVNFEGFAAGILTIALFSPSPAVT